MSETGTVTSAPSPLPRQITPRFRRAAAALLLVLAADGCSSKRDASAHGVDGAVPLRTSADGDGAQADNAERDAGVFDTSPNRPDAAVDRADAGCGVRTPTSTGTAGGCAPSAGEPLSRSPIASIRFATDPPSETSVYPFSAALGAPSLARGTRLYLSAAESTDPEGLPLQYLWSATGPDGNAVLLEPAATRVAVELPLLERGSYDIVLEVTRRAEPQASARANLVANVTPSLCATDGHSAPCNESLPVPGGTFPMGARPLEGEAAEQPQHPASIEGFELDRYEVTVGRFREYFDTQVGTFPEAGAGAHPLITGSGWQEEWNFELAVSQEQLLLAFQDCGATWQRIPADALPMNCASWYEAFAYCAWDNARLPTEAEWEYAAAGGDEDRSYPWGGSAPSAELAVFGCTFDADSSCSQADLPPVGNAPLGVARFGHEDLAGSLWEWTLDRYAPYSAEPCDNCANIDVGEGRVFRGGGFSSEDTLELRCSSRYGFSAEHRDATRGFRCARELRP